MKKIESEVVVPFGHVRGFHAVPLHEHLKNICLFYKKKQIFFSKLAKLFKILRRPFLKIFPKLLGLLGQNQNSFRPDGHAIEWFRKSSFGKELSVSNTLSHPSAVVGFHSAYLSPVSPAQSAPVEGRLPGSSFSLMLALTETEPRADDV